MGFKKYLFFCIILFLFFLLSCKTSVPYPDIPETEDHAIPGGYDVKNPKDFQNSKLLFDEEDTAEFLKKTKIEDFFYAVHKEGIPFFYLSDVNGDGVDEIAAVFVRADDFAGADIRNISREESSENSELKESRYIFVLFSMEFSDYKPARIIPLSQNSGFCSLVPVYVSADTSAFAVGFSTSVIFCEEWIIFKDDFRYSSVVLRNSSSFVTKTSDINDDGITDILEYAHVFDAASGYEIFLTWFKWDGEKYNKFKTINVMRNLRDFIEESVFFLNNKAFNSFLYNGISKKQLDCFKKFLSAEDILDKIFLVPSGAAEETLPFSRFTENSEKLNVIFPDIYEDPFGFDENNICYFFSNVKVKKNNEEAIYLVKIYMFQNCFYNRKFAFYVH